ncbi:unnamed protein product [marine sediment metagenome]|uniref:Uncharacterized protein n=1 Tax=marine sediment metagenome TaxID=412755 RepID=X0SCN9_9ZZZZ
MRETAQGIGQAKRMHLDMCERVDQLMHKLRDIELKLENCVIIRVGIDGKDISAIMLEQIKKDRTIIETLQETK